MTTTIEKICRTCKFPFSFPMAEATFPCPACGAVNGRPQAEGMSYDCLKRATRQRLACDFHNAEVSYQHVLLEYEEEHEALWGLALCRYGVEYVQDTKTGKLMPTVHSIRKKPMQADSDFLAACEYAPEELRARYEAEAAYIDDAMTGVRKLAETQQPYDVFICHKKNVPGSENLTPEYGKAAEMAHHLEKQGYRVFFAPEAIKGELGADYEAAIYHALDTAKVMLMFCSNVEYVTSAWVRSEWTRFLEMATEREDKRLVPLLYGDFTPAKLPRELRPYRLECVTMDSFTAASDILRLLEKCCGKRGVEEAAPVSKKPVREKPAPAKPAQEKPAEAKTTAPKKPAQEKPAAEKKPAPAPVPVPAKPAPVYTPESDFETAPVKGGCAITKYRGKGGNVSVPPTIGGQKVAEVGENAFADCLGLSHITLPEGLRNIRQGAFTRCSSLTGVTLPETLTVMDGYAFANSGLRSVTLPDSLAEIDGNPFSGCRQLKDIRVSPNHQVLMVKGSALIVRKDMRLVCDPAAFRMESYTVPEGVRIIGLSAFQWCSHLESVTLPESLTGVGTFAFDACRGLRSMSIPDSVGTIDLYAFSNCTALTNVTLPEAASVSDQAFAWCTSLKPENIVRRPKAGAEEPAPAKAAAEKNPAPAQKPASIYAPETDFVTEAVLGGCAITKYRGKGSQVTIPPTIGGQKVVEIGKEAFIYCSSLTSITLPEGVTSIGGWAFYDCSSLTRVVLPDSIGEMKYNPFDKCGSLVDISVSPSHPMLSVVDGVLFDKNEKRLICYPCSLTATHYDVPLGVTSIGDCAFDYCRSLTSITLPEGVTSIGNRAFHECRSLTSITLPEGVTSIGDFAFDYCSGLTSITLPEGVTSIGQEVFFHCSSLTSITLPESIREIRNNPFGGCEKLREISVTPSHGMFSVVDGVLFDKQEQHLICCPCALEASHYEVPFGVTSIGKYAFCNCKGLKNITLPGSVTSIGEYAFWDCKGLENITLPDGVTSIGDGMFWGCSSLTSIKLPKGVKSIGDRAFDECSSLTSIMLPKGLTSIGSSAFCECRSLTSITLPEGVTSIELRMFSDCSSLTSITLPKSLMSIADYAFNGCSSLRSIALPRRLQKIGYRAFDGCDKLPLSLKLKLMINEVM